MIFDGDLVYVMLWNSL